MANILVCDDERSICEMLDIALRRDGHRVETVQSGQAAKKKIDGALYDVIVTDIKMPNIDGIEVLRHAHRISPDSAVILITAVDDYEAAVEAVKAGGAFEVTKLPIPEPGPGQVRVKVDACGVCAGDDVMRLGLMGVQLPRVPGHEIAG